MPNYQNGKIYCIRSFKTDDIYIGSTTQLLCKRMDCHRSSYKSWINGYKKYCSSFELMKHGDAYIELHEKYPCDSKDELRREEGKYQREMNCVNKRKECRTPKEWREDNKEYLKEYERNRPNKKERAEQHKQYYKKHKDKLNNYSRQYYQEHKEKATEYNKQYYQNTKEDSKKKSKQRYENNSEEINKKRREKKIICSCGSEIRKDTVKRHERTQKHIQYIEAQN